ncbi:MAG: lysine--tRNA ligase [bacterium]
MLHGVNEDEFRAQRLENMKKLAELGYKPFGQAFERTGRIKELRDTFQEGRHVTMAGRLVTRREMGKSIFADLVDGSGRFQIYVKKDAMGEQAFLAFKHLDIGDHIGVDGEMFITKMGEPTIKVNQWVMLSKALLPLPEKWHGLQDVDMRFRQRYLDLIANPDVRETFNKRIDIVREIRAFLVERGFYEVETPMIQPMAGGAAANPFKTRYEALNADMFLRIAPELYLKRLLVGGFDKVFELNRNFRNEGLSRFHNPEFTMLEIYQAFGDVRTMMELVQGVITHAATKVMGGLQVGSKETPVDLTAPWREVPYRDLVKQTAGADWFDLDLAGMRAKAESLGLHVAPEWSAVEITQEVFEKLIEKTLINPTFVTRLPVELVPLAKACEDDPTVVDVFELVIGGREIAPAYSELNDPVEQRNRFEEQAGGDASKIDEDFLMAMEHGMPPAGGMGIGIDRLVMILTGAESIRDVILFPQLKSRDK